MKPGAQSLLRCVSQANPQLLFTFPGGCLPGPFRCTP